MKTTERLTEAGFDAAGIDPDPVSLAWTTPEGRRGIGSRAVAPPHANIARPAARAPLGPAAPATVH